MNTIFSHLLSEEEARLVEQSHQRIFCDEGSEMEAASEFEEQIWLEHQQQSHGEGQLARAWRLMGEVDYGRLVNALEQTLQDLPGANLCYVYEDSGLARRKIHWSQPRVTIQTIRHPQEAMDFLLHAKQAPFDLEKTPPLRFMLFPGDSEGVLGIVAHRILSASLDWHDMLHVISAFYHRQIPRQPSALPLANPLPQPDYSALNGLLRQSSIADCAGNSHAGVHLRVATATLLPAPQGAADDNSISLLADCSALFALRLASMVGCRQIALYLPTKGASDAAIEPPLSVLALECEGQSVAELARQIQRHLRGELVTFSSTQALAPLRVLWRSEHTEILRLQETILNPLMLPPGDTLWPLTVMISGDGEVDVIAGAQLAGWVAGFLLAQGRAAEEAISLASSARDSGSPDAAVQRHILDAFREALAMPGMGEHDDFFDFGGHSLTATRIIGRLKSQHHIELNINDLFSYPSAAQLACHARVAGHDSALPGWKEGGLAAVFPQAPLSLAQKSLWKIYQALGFGEAFNIPFALRFIDPLDENLFLQAFSDMLSRHCALRTVFVDIGGEIYQQVVPREMLSQYEWHLRAPQDIPLNEALRQAASHHFELDGELPVRITFLRDEENGQQVVSLLFHHIVLDEWSVNILLDELAQAFASRSAGMAPQWRHVPAPFHAFAFQQHQAGLNNQHLQFWLERLRNAPPATPIFAVAETARASHSSGGWVEFKLERAISDGLYRLAKQQGASLFNVVYSGIVAGLHLLGGARELVVGTSASGRNDAQFFDTIGYFTTVVAHRICFDEALTFNALIDEVKRQINDSMPFTDIPIDLVEEGLFGADAAHDRHMFEVFIQLHAKNKLNGAFRLADGQQIRFRQIDPEKTESVLGLQFEVMEEHIDGEPSIRVMMSYRTDHYSSAQIGQIVHTTRKLFTMMANSVGQPSVRLGALRQLPAKE